MRPALAAVAASLVAIAPLTNAFQFTKPDGSPIDVTQPIEIAWEHTADDKQAKEMGWLELEFAGGEGPVSITMGNHTRIDTRKQSSWTWYGAPAFFASLQGHGQELKEDGCYFIGFIFEVAPMNSTGSGVSIGYGSRKFNPENYPHLVSSASVASGGLGLAVIAAAACVVAAVGL